MSRFDATRRRLLLGAGGLLAAGATGCQPLMRWWMTRHDNSGFERRSASFEDGDTCLLTTEAIEGPYFFSSDALRRDITEDRPGVPLALKLEVVEADGCTPVPGALVEVWHCDALGVYSGYTDASPDALDVPPPHTWPIPPRDATRFLRGAQAADADGRVDFDTIFPGWYSPRVQHVHVKVLTGGDSALTTQLYFPEDVIAEVDAQEPYARRGPSPVTNRNDGVIHDSGGADGGWLRMSGDVKRGLVGSVTLGIPA